MFWFKVRHTRKAFTLLEFVFSFACLAIIMVSVISVTTYLIDSTRKIVDETVIENYVVLVATTLEQNLKENVDIISIDYSEDQRFQSNSLNTEISVYRQENVFGKDLYQIVVDAESINSGNRDIVRFFLRGA